MPISTGTLNAVDATLLIWALAALDAERVCSGCGYVASGYLDVCYNCGRPVCESCLVETEEATFCLTCLNELPF